MSELPRRKKTSMIETIEEPMKTSTQVSQVLTTGMLEVPLSSEAVGHIRNRHDVHLTRSQAAILRRIALGLGQKGETLANGKHVDNGTDAIRWMIENIAM
jgi:hypothetical protein